VIVWDAYQSSNRVGKVVGPAADVAGAALQTDVFAPGVRDKALANQAAGNPSSDQQNGCASNKKKLPT
jgi:hypothetical protein